MLQILFLTMLALMILPAASPLARAEDRLDFGSTQTFGAPFEEETHERNKPGASLSGIFESSDARADNDLAPGFGERTDYDRRTINDTPARTHELQNGFSDGKSGNKSISSNVIDQLKPIGQ